MRIYIISYFARENRTKRVEIHNQQVDFWLDLGLDVTVLSMEYQPEDYRDDVQYIDSPLCHPPEGRNKLKEMFYETNDPWAGFADNDCIIHPYGDWRWEPFASLGYVEHVHLWRPANGVVQPFKKEVDFVNAKYEGRPYFVKDLNLKGSLYFMQNFAKHPDLKKPIFYGGDRGAEEFSEDITLPLELAEFGYGSYIAKNCAIKEFASKSTVLERAGKDRVYTNRQIKAYAVEHFEGVTWRDKEKGTIDKTGVYWPHPNAVMIDQNNNVHDISEWHRRRFIKEVYEKPTTSKRSIF